MHLLARGEANPARDGAQLLVVGRDMMETTKASSRRTEMTPCRQHQQLGRARPDLLLPIVVGP